MKMLGLLLKKTLTPLALFFALAACSGMSGSLGDVMGGPSTSIGNNLDGDNGGLDGGEDVPSTQGSSDAIGTEPSSEGTGEPNPIAYVVKIRVFQNGAEQNCSVYGDAAPPIVTLILDPDSTETVSQASGNAQCEEGVWQTSTFTFPIPRAAHQVQAEAQWNLGGYIYSSVFEGSPAPDCESQDPILIEISLDLGYDQKNAMY